MTQRHFGMAGGIATMGALTRGGTEDAVRVIEIKTVGAYEVAVLSAEDSATRINAVSGLGQLQDRRLIGPLLRLLEREWAGSRPRGRWLLPFP